MVSVKAASWSTRKVSVCRTTVDGLRPDAKQVLAALQRGPALLQQCRKLQLSKCAAARRGSAYDGGDLGEYSPGRCYD